MATGDFALIRITSRGLLDSSFGADSQSAPPLLHDRRPHGVRQAQFLGDEPSELQFSVGLPPSKRELRAYASLERPVRISRETNRGPLRSSYKPLAGVVNNDDGTIN